MDPQALVAQQKQQFQDLLNNQKSEQQGLFGQYQQRVSAQPTLTSVFNKAQQDRGLPQLQGAINLFQGQVSDVKGLLDRLGENTQARTSGTNANQAYLDRLRASEGGALNTQLGRLGAGLEPVVGAYDLASKDVGQLLDVTQKDQARELSPLEMQIGSLGDRYTREISGFTKGKEDELTALMDKVQRDRALSDREWQRAQQLAAEERDHQRQRSYLAEQSKTQPVMAQRQDGGFNFTDASGGTISAATYAQKAGIGIGDLLYRMGQGGDRYAAQAYNQIKANQAWYDHNPDALKSEFAPIFWGM